MRALVIVLAVLLMPAFASAQSRNPRAVEFGSLDHNLPEVTGYEVDIIRVSDGAVVQTLQIGKATTTVVGSELCDGVACPSVRASVNVQPVAFGMYRMVARTVAGTIESVDSNPTADWLRAPGPPSAPRVP